MIGLSRLTAGPGLKTGDLKPSPTDTRRRELTRLTYLGVSAGEQSWDQAYTPDLKKFISFYFLTTEKEIGE